MFTFTVDNFKQFGFKNTLRSFRRSMLIDSEFHLNERRLSPTTLAPSAVQIVGFVKQQDAGPTSSSHTVVTLSVTSHTSKRAARTVTVPASERLQDCVAGIAIYRSAPQCRCLG